MALAAVRETAALGRKAGVRGTPTVFVNGVALHEASVTEIEAAIEFEQARAGAPAQGAFQ